MRPCRCGSTISIRSALGGGADISVARRRGRDRGAAVSDAHKKKAIALQSALLLVKLHRTTTAHTHKNFAKARRNRPLWRGAGPSDFRRLAAHAISRRTARHALVAHRRPDGAARSSAAHTSTHSHNSTGESGWHARRSNEADELVRDVSSPASDPSRATFRDFDFDARAHVVVCAAEPAGGRVYWCTQQGPKSTRRPGTQQRRGKKRGPGGGVGPRRTHPLERTRMRPPQSGGSEVWFDFSVMHRNA